MFAGSEILEAEFLPSVVSGPVDTQFAAGGGDGGTYDRDVRVHDAESRFSGSKKTGFVALGDLGDLWTKICFCLIIS